VTFAFELIQEVPSSQGIVHLEFSGRRDRLVGSAFVGGTIDIFDISPVDGTLTLLTTIVSDDALGPNAARQEAPHPHQALMDNSLRFFAVNDLGTDTILLIDSLDDAFQVVNRVKTDAGCGPRHAAWFPSLAAGADFPTNYIVVCELTSELHVFQLEYVTGSVDFTLLQTISTFGPGLGPANASSATAGEIAVSSDRLSLFVSNRNTGNETDSISVFSIAGGQGSSGNIQLTFASSVSSGGLVPRMFSLAADELNLFTTNQNDGAGLLAVPIQDRGVLSVESATTLELAAFGPVGQGPQFVQQINRPATAVAGNGEVSVASNGEVSVADNGEVSVADLQG
jgi:6-phosphogluconolactonase (cycloisomerase 2 family)